MKSKDPEAASAPAESRPKDFRALRESGLPPGLGKSIGSAIGAARDRVAHLLIRLRATPNRVTVLGFLLTCGSGYCLARGASHQVPYWYSGAGGGAAASLWPLAAGLLLIASAACDMLDGAVARVGNMGSRFGGILDSTVDRFSDTAIYLGCAIHFAWHGNITYQILAFVALGNTFLISYIKARAEDVIPDCSVGWWQRGERYVAILLGCFFGHMAFVLWQQAVLCAFTVWRRLEYAYRAVQALDHDQPPPSKLPPDTWWGRCILWYYPRGTWQHDVVAGANIVAIIVVPLVWSPMLAVGEFVDPIRTWLGH